MYNIKSLIALALVAISFLSMQSCTEQLAEPDTDQAKQLTIDEIKTTKGYTWYQKGYDKYTYDINVVNEVKAKLQNSGKTFLLFVNPSCACVGTQEHFPSAVKILQNAGISEPVFKVYSMTYPAMKNPFTNILKINYLPALFIMKDNVALESVFDSLYVFRDKNPKISLEESLLKCLN